MIYCRNNFHYWLYGNSFRQSLTMIQNYDDFLKRLEKFENSFYDFHLYGLFETFVILDSNDSYNWCDELYEIKE